MWDLDALMPIFSMEGHEEWVKSVTMAGQSLISASHDSTIKVWDLTEFNCMQTLKGHRDAVVTLLAHGSIVYSGSEDNSIKVWDLNSLDCVSAVSILVLDCFFDTCRYVQCRKHILLVFRRLLCWTKNW